MSECVYVYFLMRQGTHVGGRRHLFWRRLEMDKSLRPAVEQRLDLMSLLDVTVRDGLSLVSSGGDG